MRNRLVVKLLLAVTAVVTAYGCRDPQGPERDITGPSGGLLSPLTGDIRVTAATTGSDLDPDGYAVTLDLLLSKSIPTNGTVTFGSVLTGVHVVRLSGVASNCTVTSSNPQTLTILLGGVSTTFSVHCTGTTGDLDVTTSTTGSNPDPDGYTLTLDGKTSRAIGVSATERFAGLAPGDHTVTLAGAASNCTVGGSNPRTVTVTAGAVASTTFSVTCEAAATTGILQVTTSTTGDEQPDTYAVSWSGSESGSDRIGANTTGSVTVLAGDYTLTLGDVPSHCTVSGDNPRGVTVPAGGTGSATFSVSCGPTGLTTGNITITTATAGEQIPAGYTLSASGPGGSTTQPIGVNATVSFTGIASGDYTVGLSDVAANCTVSGANPRTVTVPPGATGSVTFSVSCMPTTTTGVRISGVGAIGTGVGPVPGADWQTFDFDVTDAPGGRFQAIDYHLDRLEGVASLRVDPAADPSTAITAFSRSATDPACVTFTGMGRNDFGELEVFVVTACDRGSPGAGVDFLEISVPEDGYRQGGVLVEGDITLSTTTS